MRSCRDGTTAVAGCRGGELAVWRIAGDKIASKPTVIKTGLPTSVCVIAVSPVAPDEVTEAARQLSPALLSC